MTVASAITALKTAWRDYVVDGVPSSLEWDPDKSEIRAALTALGEALGIEISSAGADLTRYETVALMNAVTTATDGQLAYVWLNNGAEDDAANGVYQSDGGVWSAATWYFAAVAGVVQPLVDAAEAAQTAAEDALADTVAAASAFSATLDGVLYEQVALIGQQTTPTNGSTGSAGTYVNSIPLAVDGQLNGVWLYAEDAGTFRVGLFTKSGDVFSYVADSAVDVVVSGAGLVDVEIVDGPMATAGMYVGFEAPINTASYAGFDTLWYSSGGDVTTDFTDAAVSAAGMQFGARFRRLISSSLTADIVKLQDDLYEQVALIGQQTTPTNGSTGSAGTYVNSIPLAVDGQLNGVWLYAEDAGTFRVGLFTKSGDVFSYVADSAVDVVVSGAGLVDVEIVDGPMATAGMYVGFEAPINTASYASDETLWYSAATGITTAFTDAAADAGGMQFGARFWGLKTDALEASVDTLTASVAALAADGSLKVGYAAPYIYARSPWSATQDLLYRVVAGVAQSASANGCIEPGSAVLIPSATVTDTPANFATAYASPDRVLSTSADDSPPTWINGLALGGNHGAQAKTLPAAGHGKANVDVGSKWADEGAAVWVLARRDDGDVLTATREPGGTSTDWDAIDNTLTGTTLTHVSGATNTGTITLTGAAADTLLYPWPQGYSWSMLLNGDATLADGAVASADFLTISERYRIPNLKAVVDDLIANVGDSTPKAFNDASITAQVEVETAYTFRPGELVKADHQMMALQGFADGKVTGQQEVAALLAGGEKLLAYVPGMATMSGYDLTGVDDITANATWLYLTAANWLDPDAPPSHAARIITSAGDVPIFGQLNGYSERYGAGDPTTRVASGLTLGLEISTINKVYMVASGVRTFAAGDIVSISGFRGFYNAADAGCTLNAVYTDGDKKVWLLAVHETLAGEWIQLPYHLRSRLRGKRLTMFDKSASATLHSAFIGERGAQISVSGGYGWLALEIG